MTILKIQSFSPFAGKKCETLSYLPQLSNDEISEGADVGSYLAMGPGYYENRFWSLYKLPMFGCIRSDEVIREIENCRREFPDAKIRVIGFDAKRQVQSAGFLIQR